MGLKEVLEKMKIVQAEADADLPAAPPHAPAHAPGRPPGPPPPPPPRRASGAPEMGDVLKSVPPRAAIDEKALAAAAKNGGGDVPDFDAIYKAAGVKDPAHGYSAYKVLEIFSSSEFASMEPRAKASALAAFLKMNPSGPVPVAHIIQDAVARDQALDGFEEFLRKKLEGRREELDKENAKLQGEIDELTQRNKEKMDGNRRTLEGERERLGNWQARKRIEERKLFDAIAPFVEENPVTLSGSTEPGKAPGKA
jgi:hypothetical protein